VRDRRAVPRRLRGTVVMKTARRETTKTAAGGLADALAVVCTGSRAIVEPDRAHAT
jgi:hypothetical protein